MDDPIDAEVRKKISGYFVDYYHFKLLAHLLGSDNLAGRLVREHERKLPTAFDFRKAKSLAYLAQKAGEQANSSESGADAEETAQLTVHSFIYKQLS